jgi:rhodanese-related sulfurtransferase
VSARAWAGLIAAATLAAGAAAEPPALAFHAPTDVPLAVAPEDVQRDREAGEEVVVIDLRPPDAFRTGHLSHARSVPLGEMRRREAEVPRAGRVVLYGGTPEEAAAAYQALREAGHRNVMVLAGGLPAWIRLGYPVETSR